MEITARPRTMLDQEKSAAARLLASLHEQHAVRIFNLALRFAADRSEAEDLTQDVFLRVWDRLPTLDRARDSRPWITRLALNVFLNGRSRPRPGSLETEPVAPTVESDPDALEEARLILGRLTPKQRFLFLLVHHESFTAAEASALTGIKLNTVKSHLKRARRTIAAVLERSSHRAL
jgi:RNA polymerase sigma-70 factor, ECF subfamily